MNVLLDLDGTLTDPREGFVSSIGYALRKLGCPMPSQASLENCIGPPLEQTMAALIGPEHLHRVDAAIALYRERYSTVGLFENMVYEGIHQALASLQQAGARLYLATSKPQVFALRILDRFGLSPFFNGIYGSELDGTRADKRELLSYLLAQEQLVARDSIMVGDRDFDVRGALANHVVPVGVLWGYGSRKELEDAGASTVLHHPSQLVDVIQIVDRLGAASPVVL